uniref:Putative terminase n=1 Tax=viral metagenome TaxID=1070528 RepID=A0A6H1ZXD2_9ZZZZ
MREHIREPINKLVDIDIYKEPEAGHEYQMGIDPSEGAEDFSAIKVIDKNTGEEVASYVSRIQPDLLAFKVVKVGHYFSTAKAVLEINGIGLATLTKLKDLNYENVFVREEYDKIAKKMTKRLGWRTTHASKPLLIGHYQELLGAKYPKIRDEKTIEEMKTYIYSDEVRKRGMGAEKSYHDDRLTAIMLAYWEVKAVYNPEDKELIIRPQESQGVKEGTFDDLKLENVIDQQTGKHWLSH